MWLRWGRVLDGRRAADWTASHAMVPFLAPVGASVQERGQDSPLQMLFSSRDERGRSHTGRAALTIGSSGAHATVEPRPLLGPGALGAFDDSGAMGSCLVAHNDRLWLYYIGWSLGVTVPFATYIGLAVSDDNGATFQRLSDGPVIGRGAADPYLATSPWVIIEDGLWRMWYASGERWEATDSGPRHYYRIVYAESCDGIAWNPTGRVCIGFATEDEYAIARPCVVRDDGRYRMWFSHRGTSYRIGHAVSEDGLVWRREDPRAGLGPSAEGWDSESVEYGCVFEHDGARWMLYNGNNYGATGIGLARWEQEW
jgi:hypothetical protein